MTQANGSIVISELIQQLIDFNDTQIRSFEDLVKQGQALAPGDPGSTEVAGELAGFVRSVISTRNTANSRLLEVHENQQVSTIDGFFPPA